MFSSVFNMCFFCPPCFPKKNDTFDFQKTWGNDFNKLQTYLKKKNLQYELIPDTCSVKITFDKLSPNLTLEDLESDIKKLITNNGSFSFEIEHDIERDKDINPIPLIVTRKQKLISSSLIKNNP